MTYEHHSACPKAQAWDIANVPCGCPNGWPRKIAHSKSEFRRLTTQGVDVLSPVSPEADLIAKDEARGDAGKEASRCIYCDRPCGCGCDAGIACHGCMRCRAVKMPGFTRVPLSEAEKMPDYDPEPAPSTASPGAPAPRETPLSEVERDELNQLLALVTLPPTISAREREVALLVWKATSRAAVVRWLESRIAYWEVEEDRLRVLAIQADKLSARYDELRELIEAAGIGAGLLRTELAALTSAGESR